MFVTPNSVAPVQGCVELTAVLDILSLSTTEASLCRREPGALSVFRLLLFLLGYQAETSAEERGIWSPIPHQIIAFDRFRTIFSASINF